MDINDALRRTENLLRDCIAETMQTKYGNQWITSHVDAADVVRWKRAKASEGRKQMYGITEERLIYFADFADLPKILEKYWTSDFKVIFDVDWTLMNVWLEALRNVRNQEAHGREILDYQKHSAVGAAGEIRTRFIRYRSKMETASDYFPRIERVNDDLGNIWTYSVNKGPMVQTPTILRDGDLVTFTITASDPQGDALEYSVTSPWRRELSWGSENVLSIGITSEDIGVGQHLQVFIRSTSGKAHANAPFDDVIIFTYTILPHKTS